MVTSGCEISSAIGMATAIEALAGRYRQPAVDRLRFISDSLRRAPSVPRGCLHFAQSTGVHDGAASADSICTQTLLQLSQTKLKEDRNSGNFTVPHTDDPVEKTSDTQHPRRNPAKLKRPPVHLASRAGRPPTLEPSWRPGRVLEQSTDRFGS